MNTNHTHYILLFLLILFFISCKEIFSTYTIKVNTPTIPSKYKIDIQSYWKLYYIGDQRTLSVSSIARNDSAIITTHKSQTMPLLACLEYDTQLIHKKEIHNTFFYCSFAAGAMIPHNVSGDQVSLDFGNQAQTAELVLFLFSRGVDIKYFNDRKLLSTLEKKTTGIPVDKQKIVQDLANHSFSYWSIVPKKTLTISLAPHTISAKSTSIWMPHIIPQINNIQLPYPGIWYFIHEQKKHVYYIAISTQKNILSNIPFKIFINTSNK